MMVIKMNISSAYRMIVPSLFMLSFAVGCGGGNNGEQDGQTEDAAPDDAVEVSIDEVRDPGPDDPRPEELQPDPDAATDMVEEDITEEDVPAEAETLCEQSGGYCWRLLVTFPACVTCPDHEGSSYLPAPQADREMGCTKDPEVTGESPWCCLPDWGTGSSVCEGAGGACYPDEGEYRCPTGWETTLIECGDDSTLCCMPNPDC
jgi:hypothetical protein